MAREVEWTWNGTFYEALTPEQKKRVRPMLTSRIFDMNSIARALVSDKSPFVIIGDSYAGGFSALLAKEINLPLLDLAAAGQTTQAIKDMVRDPSLLRGRRAVVHVISLRTTVIAGWVVPKMIV